MEHWHTTTTTTPYQREPSDLTVTSRVLTSSSGNIQSYTPDSKDGIENQDPLRLSRPGEPWPKQEIQYAIPEVKLGSNDNHSENLAHLQQRRLNYRNKFYRKKGVDPAKPYLQHPKYIQYRARQRCDTGPDGKPVWDDRIEDAFQNALVNIPPMGRRKKSQRGRPHGRNELISEWIFQETGEYRTRKQVSSHIQVLNTLLKDIPEWAALVTASDDRAGGGNEYYSDSIKDMVRNHHHSAMSSRHYYRTSTRAPNGSYGMPPGNGYIDRHSCSRLSFKMWVSEPEDISQPLHLYTRLQSNSSSSPMPLEDVKAWRNSFPSLRSIMDNWTLSDSCDIILLDASFQLMSDFPPKHAKLGISLELDFNHPSGHNKEALSMLTQWSCSTHIYQHGRLMKDQLDHFPTKDLPPGKIRPFFESKWWASTFTSLTEKRKRAEDSENDGAVEAVNETARNFFRGLTVMQEISAEIKPKDVYGASRRRRMGILLWRFSQTPAPYVGTTTWQKLIPPAEIMETRTDSSMGDMGLPHLGLDPMMDTSQPSELFTHPQGFMPMQTQTNYDMFDPAMDELCQDGFMYGTDQMVDFGSLEADASFGFDPTASAGNADMNMTYNLQPPLPQHSQDVSSQQSANMFEMPPTKRQDADRQPDLQGVAAYHPHAGKPGTQPLAKFDMNTHKVLQAQLGAEHHYYSPSQSSQQATLPSPHVSQPSHQIPPLTPTHALDENDDALRALLAASAMSDLGNAAPPSSSHLPSGDPSTHTPTLSTRPPTITYSRPTSTVPATQPLYIPTSQPFASPNPSSANTTKSTTLSTTANNLSLPLSAPALSRPPLHSHHSFTTIHGLDATPQPHHPHHNGLSLHPHPHHRRMPSLKTQLNNMSGTPGALSAPHSASAAATSFATALANLDAYSSNNDLNFGHGANNPTNSNGSGVGGGGAGGAGGAQQPQQGPSGGTTSAAQLMAEEISRPQSQPVLPVSAGLHLQHPHPHGHGHGHAQQGGLGGLYESWESIQQEMMGQHHAGPQNGGLGLGHGQGNGVGHGQQGKSAQQQHQQLEVGAGGLGGGFVDVKREDVRC